MKKLIIFPILFVFYNILAQNANPYIQYYYLLNKAIDAKTKGNQKEFDASILKAYSIYPEKERIETFHQIALLQYFIRKDSTLLIVKNFAATNPFVGNKEKLIGIVDYKLKNDSLLHFVINNFQAFKPIENYYIPDHKQLSAKLDTMLAIDQYIRGATWIDTTKVNERFKTMSCREISNYNFKQLKILFKAYGFFGSTDCETCNIFLFVQHLDNAKLGKKLKPDLINMIKLGKLDPSFFTSGYDRAYNSKTGRIKYYFCLNYPPLNLSHFTPLEELKQHKIHKINKRRYKIGIPPLPYLYHNLFSLVW